MKNLLLLFAALVVSSCVPSFHEGPDPHSIEFNNKEFEKVRTYLSDHPEYNRFSIENAPKGIPTDIINKMDAIGYLDYQLFNEKYQIFFCGYGILDQPAWGFVYGNLNDSIEKTPFSITNDTSFFRISYLEALENNWFRFSGNIGKRFNK